MPNRTFRNLCRLAFWAALVFAFVMAVLPHPPQVVEVNDKFQHMLAFATLAVLGVLAYPALVKWKLGLGLLALGGLIEIVQMIPVLHRTADWADFVADGIAVVAGLLAMMLIVKVAGRFFVAV